MTETPPSGWRLSKYHCISTAVEGESYYPGELQCPTLKSQGKRSTFTRSRTVLYQCTSQPSTVREMVIPNNVEHVFLILALHRARARVTVRVKDKEGMGEPSINICTFDNPSVIFRKHVPM